MKKSIQFSLVCILMMYNASLFSQDFIEAFRLGASQQDEAYGMIEDMQGNLYLSGNFEGTVDFDPGSDEAWLTALNSYDGYLAKYDTDKAYVWAIGIAGTQQVYGRHIIADGSGNVYMAGYFNGQADFDPSGNEYLLESSEMDGFLAKYDTDGNFVWAFDFGNEFNTIAFDVCFDNEGNIWVSGKFKGDLDFDPSGNEFILSGHGFMDAFIAKYTPDMELLWAGEIGGESSVFYLPTLECDDSGNLYYTGYFTNEVDLDPGEDTYLVSSSGDSEIMLLKLDPSGNFQWGFAIGGAMQDMSRELVLIDDRIIITGIHEETIDFDPSDGEAIFTSEGDYDTYIAAYTTDGDYIWAKTLVGTDPSEGISVARDNANNIYITGSFYGTTDFDPSEASYELTSSTMWDIYVAKYDSDGNFHWAIQAGGNENDYGHCILVDNAQEEVFVCGKFKGWAEFDHNGAGSLLVSNGGFDSFLAAYTTPSTGVGETSASNKKIEVFPNPAKEIVNIRFIQTEKAAATISIHSIDGKLLQEIDLGLLMADTYQFEIGISELKKGSYIIGVNTNTGYNRRLLVIR